MGRLGRYLSRLFNAVPPAEMQGIQLQGPYWEVATRRLDQSAFFRALPRLIPEDAMVLLEGGAHPPALRHFLEEHRVPVHTKIALGTIWPRGNVFHLPATPAGDCPESCV